MKIFALVIALFLSGCAATRDDVPDLETMDTNMRVLESQKKMQEILKNLPLDYDGPTGIY
ncbi:hypothetical protein RBA41_31115 [Massilia sp. CCM 9210]|uniref:hypothetical protein n=1 Tax=Massilia scottii TaxID=3057166 RepID=UPI002796BC00|nr:hypothetical protein [Massilia sp. CCM 9210]MDQ1817760.1 hypothetical protein [Massilia sp. CCM 9210]